MDDRDMFLRYLTARLRIKIDEENRRKRFKDHLMSVLVARKNKTRIS